MSDYLQHSGTITKIIGIRYEVTFSDKSSSIVYEPQVKLDTQYYRDKQLSKILN